MNYEKFKDQLGTWGEILKPFIVSENCDKIYTKLKADTAKGVKICPDSRDTFRAFKECPWEELKVVFLLQDPYPWIKKGVKVADGIAMSCKYASSYSKDEDKPELQPSLNLFYDAIEDDLYKGLNLRMLREADLVYLANQGVLFLNTSLTVRANNTNSHRGLWHEFILYVLKIIQLGKESCLFVLAGDEAQAYSSIITPSLKFRQLLVEHPARASHEGRSKWIHKNIFSQINEHLFLDGKNQITWIYEEAPF